MINLNTGEMLFYMGAVLICFSIIMLAITVRAIRNIEVTIKKILEKLQVQCEDTYNIYRNTNYILNVIDTMRLNRRSNNEKQGS